FFASGLAQNGEDSEGFDGFLFDDIRTEIKRAGKLPCTKCHIRGAATGCCIPKCRSAFHFCCGLKMSALFQFYGSFCAFCRKHRPSQSETIRTQMHHYALSAYLMSIAEMGSKFLVLLAVRIPVSIAPVYRDAVWEQGDAYADLLQRYNKCDTKPCLCPEGREFSGEHK
ncbi:hypothetical protein QZH41_016277, partial [Actinostola sp. cb2023]